MAMSSDQFDKILDRIPFFDGSGRRRFVSGGIVLIGIVALNWGALGGALKPLGTFDAKDFIASPMIALIVVLMIYALGSIIDLFGELFLVRAASGIFWALNRPLHVVQRSHNEYAKKPGRTRITKTKDFLMTSLKTLWAIIWVIPHVLWSVLMGFVGKTRYSFQIKRVLSKNALKFYTQLPEKVSDGIYHPVGNNAQVAQKYLIDQFTKESDRKWGWRQITRAKDVAATTTALLVILFHGVITGKLAPTEELSENAVEILNLINAVEVANRRAYSSARLSLLKTDIERGRSISRHRTRELLQKIKLWKTLGTHVKHLDRLKTIQSQLYALQRKTRFSRKVKYPELFLDNIRSISNKIRANNRRLHQKLIIRSLLSDIKYGRALYNVYHDKLKDEISRLNKRQGLNKKDSDLKNHLIKLQSTIAKYVKKAQTSSLIKNITELQAESGYAYRRSGLSRILRELQLGRTYVDYYSLKSLGRLIDDLQSSGQREEVKKISDKLTKYNSETKEKEDSRSQLQWLLNLLALSFLLLYLGFFVCLTNAISSIVEALSQQGEGSPEET